MVLVSSSRRSVSQGAEQKIAHEKNKKNTRRGEAKERLWANLTKGRSGIPGSGIPSDWSILTDFANTRRFLTQDNLVLSTGLIKVIGHRKEIRKLTFWALALHRTVMLRVSAVRRSITTSGLDNIFFPIGVLSLLLTASFNFFARYFSPCAPTNWTPRRGYGPWCVFVRDRTNLDSRVLRLRNSWNVKIFKGKSDFILRPKKHIELK